MTGFIVAVLLFGSVFVLFSNLSLKSILDELRRRIGAFFFSRRMKKCRDQISTALAVVANSLRAGISLQQSIKSASDEISAPLGEELAALTSDVESGVSIERAADKMAQRVACEEAILFAQSISALRRCGGDMIAALDIVMAISAERKRLSDKIKTCGAQARFQMWTLAAMPWFLVVALHFVSPGYVSPLIRSRLGIFLIMIALSLEGVGIFWIHLLSKRALR
ncbi:MAG TPA: type II secretion system F family protein [bacterium]|nr:hypothetical protein [Myxococcales bacterium]HQG13532.1 type II secretion system F family protein [bacterium]HQH80702.1 type II secretion system F family protein [bacterium]